MTTEERDFQARVVHALRRPMTEEEVWEASIAPEDGDPVTEVLRLRAKLEQVTRRGIQLERQVRADHGGSIPGNTEASVVETGGELFAVEVPHAAT